MARRTEKRGVQGLLAVSLIRGVAGPGLNASLGIFFPTVAAMLGASVGALSWSVSIASLAGMLFLPLAPRMYVWLGVRHTAVLGVLLVSVSFFLTGFARGLVWWYVLAVPFGIGTVLVVNMLGPLVLSRSEEGYGSALGRMMTLAGLVAIPVQPLITAAITRGGSRAGYVVGGVTALLVMLPGALILPRRARAAEGTVHEEAPSDMAPHVFLLLFILLIVIVATNAFHQHIAVFGRLHGHHDTTIGASLAVSVVGAAVGGLLLGHVTHRFGGLSGGYLTLVVGAAAAGLFLVGGRHAVWFSFACFLHGVASAAIGITVQYLARERCRQGYDRVLARLLTAIPLATVVATPLWGAMYDRTGGYTVVLWSLLALAAIGGVCLSRLARDTKEQDVKRTAP